jgi:hypothetical protein
MLCSPLLLYDYEDKIPFPLGSHSLFAYSGHVDNLIVTIIRLLISTVQIETRFKHSKVFDFRTAGVIDTTNRTLIRLQVVYVVLIDT